MRHRLPKWRSNNFYAYTKNPQAKLSWVDPPNFVAMKSNVHLRYSTKLSGKSIDFNFLVGTHLKAIYMCCLSWNAWFIYDHYSDVTTWLFVQQLFRPTTKNISNSTVMALVVREKHRSQRTSNAERVSMSRCHHDNAIKVYPVIISDKTSYCKISQRLEGTRSVFRIARSLWNLTDTSTVVTSMFLSNLKAVW